jgi:hypothetical protein
MPDDPLNTDNTPPVVVPPQTGARRAGQKCVFCECVMTGDGQDIWHLGDKAKEYKKHQETIAKKDEEISKLSSEITELKRQLAALSPSSGSGTATHRPGSRVGS